MTRSRRTILIVATLAACLFAATATAQALNWNGVWLTNWGDMTLTQSGSTVTGSYTWDQGQVSGTVLGDTFSGTWTEAPSRVPPSDAGDLSLDMSRDGMSFRGYWRYGFGGTTWSGDWTGTRKGGTAWKSFSVKSYANNVAVVAPLVGRWQLGVFRLTGSGRVSSSGKCTGTLHDTDDPMFARYPNSGLTAKVLGCTYSTAGLSQTLVLRVKIVSVYPRGPRRCRVGQKGTLTIIDNPGILSNGKDMDAFTETWRGFCGHTHGVGNEDGGARTSPTTGGPPSGGQWTIATIR